MSEEVEILRQKLLEVVSKKSSKDKVISALFKVREDFDRSSTLQEAISKFKTAIVHSKQKDDPTRALYDPVAYAADVIRLHNLEDGKDEEWKNSQKTIDAVEAAKFITRAITSKRQEEIDDKEFEKLEFASLDEEVDLTEKINNIENQLRKLFNSFNNMSPGSGLNPVDINSNLIPSKGFTYDIGTADKPFKDLYLSDASLKIVTENENGTTTTTSVSGNEITQLEGLTANTAELNVLDGITANTSQLNLLANTSAANSSTFLAGDGTFKVAGGGGGSQHVIQKNDLEDSTDSTTSLNAKTNLLFDSNTFRVTNDSGTDSTQVRLQNEFTGTANGTALANKALVLGTARAIDNIGAMTAVTSFSGGAITSNATVTASKVNVTSTGAESIQTAGGITMDGNITGAGTINATDIDLQDTNSEAVIQLHRNETGSNENFLGKLKFKGQNSADEEINFAQIGGIQKTVTDGSEDGQLDFNVMNGGTLNTSVTIDEDGLVIKGSRTLTFGSTTITSSANELNILDADTSASNFNLQDADQIVVNDGPGTMKQVALSRLKTYIGQSSTSLTDLGVTATATELNVLDGINSNTAQLNFLSNTSAANSTTFLAGDGTFKKTLNSGDIVTLLDDDNKEVLSSNSVSAASTGQYVGDSFPTSTYRSAKYIINISDTDDTTYYIGELVLVHNGTTVNFSIYGETVVGSLNIYPTYSADITNNNVRLLITTVSNSQTVNISRIGIDV